MTRFVLYGLFGWCAEVVWTAVVDNLAALRAGERIDRRLKGTSYLWMFPIYGGGSLLFELAHAAVQAWAWGLRGGIYMLGCFAVEYVSGMLIKQATGVIPWDYSGRRWSVQGVIRLDYAPVWFCFGLILERIEALARAAEPAISAALR